MIETLCLIFAKFSYYILMLNSYFSHAMKNCALFKAPLRYIFLTLLLKILIREIFFFAKMIKLTISLVEPRTHKLWHSL
jgi:hypothetical protein